MSTFLDFEKPVAELEGKIKELRHTADGGDVNISEESGNFLFDRSAIRALTLANPFPPLPPDFPKSSLGVQFAFKQGF